MGERWQWVQSCAVCDGRSLGSCLQQLDAARAGKHQQGDTRSHVAGHKFLRTFAAFGTGICLWGGKRGGIVVAFCKAGKVTPSSSGLHAQLGACAELYPSKEELWSQEGPNIPEKQAGTLRDFYSERQFTLFSCTHPNSKLAQKSLLWNKLFQNQRARFWVHAY